MNIAVEEGQSQKRTIQRATPTIKRFLTTKDWETGGKAVMDELNDITTGLAKNGILPNLAGDVRRDYVQMLLAKTYHTNAQAAANNANNVATNNNKNLVTALVGKDHGDAGNNLLKTVKDGLKQNAVSITNKIGQKADYIGHILVEKAGSIESKLDENAVAIKAERSPIGACICCLLCCWEF